MVVNSIREVEDSIHKGISYVKIPAELSPLTKVRLFLTGNSEAGVEVFGVGGMEARNFFLVEYMNLINMAVYNHYRVFVYREGELFQKGIWYLEFEKDESN